MDWEMPDYYNHTLLHPVGLIAVLSLGILLVLLPRSNAIAPMIVLACLIPSAQRLVLLGADFTLLRILILFGWMRLLLRSEYKNLIWNRLDTLVVLWMLSTASMLILRVQDSSVFINQIGWLLDGLGMYFLFRCLLRGWDDLDRVCLVFVMVSFPVGIAFCFERFTGHNLFSVFGGVELITAARDGKLRCQGPYSHPILAGCFWASVTPWMLVTFQRGRKWLASAGVIAAIVIVINCASSTPLLGLCFSALGFFLYFVRQRVRLIRWAFFLSLIFLHLIMNKPVWHLLSRVNVVGGSTGWHRYMIMDATINNFSKWWLMGDSNPMSWGVWEMRDVTNQYIVTAVNGGLLSLVLFVAALTAAFSMVGKALTRLDTLSLRGFTVWCVGVSLFVHVCTFFAVTYFGQIIMLTYLTLALCGSLQGMILEPTGKFKGDYA
jgi:hypothetical protein